MANYGFRVFEDNGGGLALFVMLHGKPVWCGAEYEFSPGSLCRDIEAIYTGEYSEPEFWESSFEAAMNEFYSDCVCSSAVELIAASENGCDLNTCFHFERMGEAGHREFDGTDFDPDAWNVMSEQSYRVNIASRWRGSVSPHHNNGRILQTGKNAAFCALNEASALYNARRDEKKTRFSQKRTRSSQNYRPSFEESQRRVNL